MALAYWMAKVPMPPAPPWISTVSPSPRCTWSKFETTVAATSITPAALTRSTPGGGGIT